MFSLLTKRAERIADHLPDDWGDGWDNVTFAVSCENQKRLDERMPHLLALPAKHRWISLKPFIGEIDLSPYLAAGKVEWVLAGGENYLGSRPLHCEWVKAVSEECRRNGVKFTFGQTGNIFVTDGVERRIRDRTEQAAEALRTGLDNPPVDIGSEVAKLYAEKVAKKAAFAGRVRRDKQSEQHRKGKGRKKA